MFKKLKTLRKNFSLAELLLLVIVLSLLAAIGIPRWQKWKINTIEGKAIGCLRTISCGQTSFQTEQVIDQEWDGTGEFATLGELTDTAPMRLRGGSYPPSYIPKNLAPKAGDNYAYDSGYRFQVFLANTKGDPITDNGANKMAKVLKFPGDKNAINGQETNFRAYAWPERYGISGFSHLCN